MNSIPLNDSLSEMNNGRPFQIRFVKCNREKRTGGKIIELRNAIRVGAKYSLNDSDMINVRRVDNADHPYPVHIHLITEFNSKKVFV